MLTVGKKMSAKKPSIYPPTRQHNFLVLCCTYFCFPLSLCHWQYEEIMYWKMLLNNSQCSLGFPLYFFPLRFYDTLVYKDTIIYSVPYCWVILCLI